jgi:hypothetical protein
MSNSERRQDHLLGVLNDHESNLNQYLDLRNGNRGIIFSAPKDQSAASTCTYAIPSSIQDNVGKVLLTRGSHGL